MTWLRDLFGAPKPAEPASIVHGAANALPSPPLIDDYDERLPDSTQKTVREIRDLIGELERRAARRSLIDQMLELQRLKSKHLPSLLRSYVEIPPEHRAEIFRETGQSASVLLNERLEKIRDRLKETSRQLARGNLNAFAENIRFVDMRYGSSSPFD